MEQQQTELMQEIPTPLPSPQQPVGQQPYHTPTLVCYGELAALVQGNPGGGADGGALPDCTRS